MKVIEKHTAEIRERKWKRRNMKEKEREIWQR